MLRPCHLGKGASETRTECMQNVRLAGTDVAFEEEGLVVVRDLRTGRTLHQVPTGTPLKPSPEYPGVGKIVALVLKSDGSAAWIAEDDEHSHEVGGLHEVLYFDVEALDTSGTRQLAAGTDIDPSSLALASGGSGIGGHGRTVEGNTVYWTQAGKPFSAPLN